MSLSISFYTRPLCRLQFCFEKWLLVVQQALQLLNQLSSDWHSNADWITTQQSNVIRYWSRLITSTNIGVQRRYQREVIAAYVCKFKYYVKGVREFKVSKYVLNLTNLQRLFQYIAYYSHIKKYRIEKKCVPYSLLFFLIFSKIEEPVWLQVLPNSHKLLEKSNIEPRKCLFW